MKLRIKSEARSQIGEDHFGAFPGVVQILGQIGSFHLPLRKQFDQRTGFFRQGGAGGQGHAHGRVDLVGDAGHQFPQGRQFFGENQLALRPLQVFQCLLQFPVGTGQLLGALHHPRFQFFIEAKQLLLGQTPFSFLMFQTFRHAVKGRGQLPQLSLLGGHAGSRTQIAGLQPAGGIHQPVQATHDGELTHKPGGNQRQDRCQEEEGDIADH